jgi:hypothetical protein
MKPRKEFDSVVMKTEIQERLLREVAELGEEEAQRRRAERLVRDPILSRFLRTKLADVPGSTGVVPMPSKGSKTGRP